VTAGEAAGPTGRVAGAAFPRSTPACFAGVVEDCTVPVTHRGGAR
jgi:hypothetical protein